MPLLHALSAVNTQHWLYGRNSGNFIPRAVNFSEPVFRGVPVLLEPRSACHMLEKSSMPAPGPLLQALSAVKPREVDISKDITKSVFRGAPFLQEPRSTWEVLEKFSELLLVLLIQSLSLSDTHHWFHGRNLGSHFAKRRGLS